MFRTTRGGFSLLETLAAIAILALLFSVAFVIYSRFITTIRLDQTTEEIVSVIREAQRKTLARDNGYAYGVHLETDSFTLFRAPTYALGAAGNAVHDMPSGFSITAITLTGGGSDIIFQPLNGETNTYGTFSVEHGSGQVSSSSIRIYASGISEIE